MQDSLYSAVFGGSDQALLSSAAVLRSKTWTTHRILFFLGKLMSGPLGRSRLSTLGLESDLRLNTLGLESDLG